MYVFRVITIFVMMTALMNTVLSQEVDCTNSEQIVSKEVFDKSCRKTFCKCFTDECPPEWSRDFVDGLAVWPQIEKAKNWDQCVVSDGLNLYFEWTNFNGIYLKYRVYFWRSIRVNFNYRVAQQRVVRRPDYTNISIYTEFFKPKLNTKGLFEFELYPNNAQIFDHKSEDPKKRLYSSSYLMSSTDPLFDNRIIGPMKAEYKTAYWQLDRYYGQGVEESIPYNFTAIHMENNFYLKFNPRIQSVKIWKYYNICLGRKRDPQTGRKYWTEEGCQAVLSFVKLNYATPPPWLWYEFEIRCECDFESIGFDTPEDKGTTQTKVPETNETVAPDSKTTTEAPKPGNGRTLVDGFNFPEGMPKPQKLISPSYATKATVWGISIMIFIILVLIVSMIGLTAYHQFYKTRQNRN